MYKKLYLFSLSVICLFSLSLMSITTYAATSSKCPGEDGYNFTNYRGHATRNPTNGGFVSNSAFVDETAYIAPTAAVCNSASVLKYARIYGKAIISDEAEVTDKARVYGNARVFGTAFVGGEAKVSDHAQVSGEAIVEGVTWVRGYTNLTSGVITEGTKKSVKPQSMIDAELRKIDADLRKVAQEKQDREAKRIREAQKEKEQCKRDWYAKETRLDQKYENAKNACTSKRCRQYTYNKAWAKKLKRKWDEARRRVERHYDKRRQC